MKSSTPFVDTITRKWVTPFTTGAFFLSAVTGILLFFKVHYGLIKWSHEWLSWLLVIGVVLHIGLNYRPLIRTLVRPVGKAILVLFALLLLLSFLPIEGGHHGKERGHNRHTEYLEQPPASQQTGELALARLNKNVPSFVKC